MLPKMRLLVWMLVAGLLAIPAVAADKADPTGTWNWTVTRPDGQKVEVTGTFKLDGEKLTGTVKALEMESKIQDGTFKNGEVTFTSIREREGMKFTVNYKGKLDGDMIKGTINAKVGDQERKLDWAAKRAK